MNASTGAPCPLCLLFLGFALTWHCHPPPVWADGHNYPFMGLEVSEHTIFSACYHLLGLRVRFLQGQSAEVMFVPSGKTLFKQSK